MAFQIIQRVASTHLKSSSCLQNSIRTAASKSVKRISLSKKLCNLKAEMCDEDCDRYYIMLVVIVDKTKKSPRMCLEIVILRWFFWRKLLEPMLPMNILELNGEFINLS